MHTKRFIPRLLSILLALSLLPIETFAVGIEQLATPHSGSAIYINPLYPDASVPEFPTPPDISSWNTKDIVSCSTVEEAALILRDAMENRMDTVQLSYTWCESASAIETLFYQIIGVALEHTSVPTQGDYLQWQFGGVNASWSYYSNSDGSVFDIGFTFTMAYYSTAEQEAELDTAVDSLLTELDLSAKTDYEKVCGIYDYICDNVVYDYEHLDMGTDYPLMFTAYAALMDGTAVCQGYANLFYRLALELGVDTRIITGDAGGPHAWNIVELDDKYYYLDATWDAPLAEIDYPYEYFLLGSETFYIDHTPESEYLATDFLAKYPIDTKNYVHTKPEDPDEPETVIASGYCGNNGNNVTWTLTNHGLLTVSGMGEITTNPWLTYRESLVKIIIEVGVTSICNSAFFDCTNLISVMLPEGLTNIGEYAFEECTNLVEIDIPASVTEIGEFAFYKCDSLQRVVIPYNVTQISNYLFYSCDNLVSVTLPEGLTEIGSYSFFWCNNLVDINIPASVTKIGNSAFSNCHSWQGSIVLPYGITKISDRAFDACESLTSITLPRSITEIGEYAFSSCHGLTELVIPDGVTKIEKMAFYYSTGLQSLVIPSSVTSIGEGAIGFTNLHSIYYTGTEDQWNHILFLDSYDWSEYVEIVFNWTDDSVVYTVSFDANGGSGAMDTIIIDEGTIYLLPNCLFTPPAGKQFKAWSINGVEYAVRDRITISEDITVKAIWENVYAIASGTCGENLIWKLTEDGTLTISGEGPMTESPWRDYCDKILFVVVEDGVTCVASSAFDTCSEILRVMLPDSVTSIGSYAFARCQSLIEINLPDSLTSIGDGAFYYCGSITSLMIPNGVTTINEYAFYMCKNLENITIPDSVTSIADYAFYMCESLKSLTIPDSVTSIADYVFYYCKSLLYIKLPAGLTELNLGMFFYCEKLESIEIPKGVTHIGDHAFYYCRDLKTITIPASVTHIGQNVFGSCDDLESIHVESENKYYCSVDGVLFNKNMTQLIRFPSSHRSALYVIPAGITDIASTAFDNCLLSYIEIPASVTSIGDAAFYFCQFLKTIKIPDGVSSIGNNMFQQCFHLAEVSLPATVTSIGNHAFYGCESLKTVCFNGTEEQWDAITVNVGNDYLLNAEIIFTHNHTYGDISYTWSKDNVQCSATSICTDCGKTVTETIFATIETSDPTCIEVGFTIYTATFINNGFAQQQKKVEIPAKGHIEEVIPGYPATLTEPGLTDGMKCSVCGEILVAQEEIPALTEISGTCGENLTWTLTNEGVLTISGEGAMYNFTVIVDLLPLHTVPMNEETTQPAPWSDYTILIAKVVVEDGVTSIGDNAFAACENLAEIEIPETVTTIGDNVFTGCEALETVTYTGTEEQWAEITRGEGNETLEDAEIVIADVLRGDVNGDGYVNSNDAIYLLRYTLSPNRYPINQNGDMNGDGYVNSNDAIYLLRHTLTPNRYPLY